VIILARPELRTSDALNLACTVAKYLDGRSSPEALRDALERAEAHAGYNAWTNYATWAVHRWLTQNEEIASTSRILARDAPTEQAAAAALRMAVDAANPLHGDTGLYGDLIAIALSTVDWEAVAVALRAPDPE
jgi:hypothetical protein